MYLHLTGDLFAVKCGIELWCDVADLLLSPTSGVRRDRTVEEKQRRPTYLGQRRPAQAAPAGALRLQKVSEDGGTRTTCSIASVILMGHPLFDSN